MKTALIAIISFCAGIAMQEAPQQLMYELDPPGFTVDDDGTVCMHFLPPDNNFAANVNVMAQPYEGTLAEYDALSREQFDQLGVKVLHADLNDGVLIYEYTGRQQGRNLRWYSVAHKKGNKVYLATATGLASAWEDQSASLKASVDSFKLID